MSSTTFTPPTHSKYRTISILGLPIFAQSRENWQTWLNKTIDSQIKSATTPTLIFTPNAEQLVQAYQDPGFLDDLQQADILLPDGVGPILASYWFDRHHPFTERLAGADVINDVLAQAKAKQLSVLIVGGRGYGFPSQLGFAPIKLPLATGSTLEVNWMPGYADIAHPTPTEHATVRFVINHQKPAIVLVAFGAPWQEAWAIRHQELLGAVGTKLVMAVGGSIDFMLGKVPRAPKFMRQFGLEWLFRLVLEPWRWQRQLRLVSFVQLLLSGKLQQLPMAVNTTKKDAAWRD